MQINRRWIALLAFPLALGHAAAMEPDEVTGVMFTSNDTLNWDSGPGSLVYNVYRAALSELEPGTGGQCYAVSLATTSFQALEEPSLGKGFFFLVTAESSQHGEGTAGTGTLTLRAARGNCAAIMQAHVLDRTGHGQDDWSLSRIQSLGLQAYIDEQLDPALIDETTNVELSDRLALIEPPANIFDLLALQVVKGVYSRRQLEQRMAAFWANHFNTDFSKVAGLYVGAFPDCVTGLPQCDPFYPNRGNLEGALAVYREMEDFRNLAFNGTFRQMLEASAKSAAMIIYLDTITNVIPIANENYGRELLELHALGVAGGYTQTDVEELARVFTGWSLCKKETANINNPVAPCLSDYWEELPAGQIVATFVSGSHDCNAKTLFAGTPQEVNLSNTCGLPSSGSNEVDLVLDAIAAHPATKRFISKKILQYLVTDEPTEAMIDVLVAEWDDAGHPQGVGDMREVTRAALTLGFDPKYARTKVKSPLEHFISVFRAIRGSTDGVDSIINYMVLGQHIPHYNPVPTGYPEDGDSWIDTTNTLTRQNFGLHLSAFPPGTFGSDPIGLLNDNGVVTTPGNSQAIVDFFNQHLFSGTLSSADIQGARDFLDTDNFGVPTPYDDNRIRRALGMMLGFAQYQEQ